MWTRPVLAPPETIDLAAAITKKDACQAAEQVAYVKKRHPEVTEIVGDFKFRGQEQKKTPVADFRGAVGIPSQTGQTLYAQPDGSDFSSTLHVAEASLSQTGQDFKPNFPKLRAPFT